MRVIAQRLAAIAEVPPNYRVEFRGYVTNLVSMLWNRDRRSTDSKPGGKLIQAADAARALLDNYTKMNTTDRDWVEHIKQTQTQFIVGEIHNLQISIYHIALILNSAIGKPCPPPQIVKIAGGTVRDQILREFLFGLLSAAAETRGKFTFDKNREGGSLAQALDLLRNHLPAGSVPDPLPISTVQRLKSEFKRLTS
ncbi:MAG TPA: hypothetical protein VIJ79_17355 [Acidobacteriaceae bacterium]